MRLVLFVMAELVICALLGGVMFYALIWQPVWLQVVSAIVMAAGFFAINFGAGASSRDTFLVIWVCPLSYSFWLLGLMASSAPTMAFFVVLTHYLSGVLLLWFHVILNRRFCR
jgi:hypothetical protein